MSDRYQGGVIRAVPLAPTSSSASGIWTMEQQAKAQAAGNWPTPPLLVDPNFNQVSMLLGGEPANSLDYTAFSDASTNNFLITPTGTPYGNAFSPYNSTFSNYFDGSGDYVTSSSTGIIPTSGSWTVDGWIFLTGSSSNAKFLSQGTSGSSGRVSMGVEGGSWWVQVGENQINTGTPTRNQWLYVGITFNGTTLSFYVNGSLIGSTTPSQSVQNAALTIGTDWLNYYWSGYISNLRISNTVRTVTSVPTALFTVDANTVFLGCASNRFIDQSANAYALTVSGNTAISGFIPFTDTDTTTGSGYFDGSGDYLSGAANSAYVFGTGDFTVECWVYQQTVAAYTNFVSNWRGLAEASWVLSNYSTAGVVRFADNSSNYLVGSTTLKAGTWNHIAVSRSGTSLKLFINGVQDASATNSTSFGTTNTGVNIGAYYDASYSLTGNISNLRIVKGTAVYTSNFTPPTAPLTAVTNTQLLTLQDRAANQNFGYIDQTKNNQWYVYGNPTQGTFSPFSQPDGYWGNYFDGSGDYLSIPDSTAFDLGSGSFTLEAWINMADVTPSKAEWIISQWLSDTNNSWGFRVETSGSLNFYYSADGSNASTLAAASPGLVAGTWHHIAVVRNSSTLTIYVDGVSKASTSWAGTLYNSSTTVMIGNQSNTGLGQTFTGYISNARVVKGTAVYTSAFTPSTTPLTAISGTSLLTCQSNRFVDNSSNGFFITPNGHASVQSFGPFAPTDAYDPAVNGGSNFTDPNRTGRIATFTCPGFPGGTTANFCIEGWFYPLNTGDLFGKGGSAVYETIVALINGTGNNSITVYVSNTSDSYIINGATFGNVQFNQWHHIAVYRVGNTFYGACNGTVQSLGTSSNAIKLNTAPFVIGGYSTPTTPAGNYYGYISSFRVTNGNSVYTSSNFTPPTALFAPTTGTVSLMQFTNAGIWDSAARNDLYEISETYNVTSTSKFGSGSIYFPGTDGYYKLSGTWGDSGYPSVNVANLGTGDFTVEAWAYFGSVGSGGKTIIGTGNYTAPNIMYQLRVDTATPKWFYGNSGSQNFITSSTNISANTWYHFAVVRYNGTTTMYLNGTSVGSASDSSNYTTTDTAYVGAANFNGTITDYMNGYIDDLRVTKGVARYTTNFTPANYPFPVK